MADWLSNELNVRGNKVKWEVGEEDTYDLGDGNKVSITYV